LDRNLITKVADFGLSHVKQDASNKTYGIGQIPWMAPEGVCVCVWCGVVSVWCCVVRWLILSSMAHSP
jgi:hypothetical protein